MMLRPAMLQIIKKDDSYYSFVVAIAKRARQIANQAQQEHIALEEKPVKLAVDEFAAGKYKMINNVAVPMVQETAEPADTIEKPAYTQA